MKFLLTILIIASLAGGAVIGILTMNGHGDCFASYASGMACPIFNTLAYVGMHVNFARNFSEAFLITVLAAGSILAVFVSYIFSPKIFYANEGFFKYSFSENYNTGKRKQISWLSLFENSPNIA